MQAELREAIERAVRVGRMTWAGHDAGHSQYCCGCTWDALEKSLADTRPAPEPQPATAGREGWLTEAEIETVRRTCCFAVDTDDFIPYVNKLAEMALAALQSTPPPSAEGNEGRLREALDVAVDLACRLNVDREDLLGDGFFGDKLSEETHALVRLTVPLNADKLRKAVTKALDATAPWFKRNSALTPNPPAAQPEAVCKICDKEEWEGYHGSDGHPFTPKERP